MWWKNPWLKPLEQHPVAHALGGLAFFGAAVFDVWVFSHVSLAIWAATMASEAQLLWEMIQVEVTPGYSFAESGVWDWLTATIVAFAAAGSCWLAEAFTKWVVHR